MDVPQIVKEQGVAMYDAGASAQAVGKRFGYGSATVMQWVEEAVSAPRENGAQPPVVTATPWLPEPRATLPVHPPTPPAKPIETYPEWRAKVEYIGYALSQTGRSASINGPPAKDTMTHALELHTKTIVAWHAELGIDAPVLP